MISTLFWTLIGFLSGAVPYSVWIGRLARGEDIRNYGDKNPGATNVLRAAGIWWSLPAFFLDALKGAIPVGLAWFFAGIQGWFLVPAALAPVFGHAFSPFLHFRGGKSVAVTFGIWAGLTLGIGPTVFGLLLLTMFLFIRTSGWALILAFLLFGAFIIPYYGQTYPEFALIWTGNLLLLTWTHRSDLSQKPQLRRFRIQ